MLSNLVAEPSLLGQEMSAQALMRRAYAGLGLVVEEFAIDEAKLRAHEAYSPSLVSYEGRRNVVGLHRAAGPRAAARSSSTATSTWCPWAPRRCGPTRPSAPWCRAPASTAAAART
jgi:hypothetical protein